MKLRKKFLFYLLAIISALALSAETAVDAIILHDIIEDPWVLGLSFFIVATIFTFLVAGLLSIRIKKRSLGSFIDPSFTRIRLIKKKEILYHIIA